jgi:phenylacetate-CoA ligase
VNAMLQPQFHFKIHRATLARYFDRETETLPRERLEALQLERLRASVENAWENVAPHRERLRAAGMKAPGALRRLDDLAALPFMTKSDLRDHYPFGLFARPRRQIARIHASSGTTG